MSGNIDEPTENQNTQAGTPLYNANDGLFGRNGGPYGDEVTQRLAEEQAATREGRKPDYKNAAPGPGILLLNPAQATANYNPTLIAGDERRSVNAVAEGIKAPVQAKVPDDTSGAGNG